MRVHVISDLHLEFAGFEPPLVDADLVILAGDIDVGVRGVRWAKKVFGDLPVIYVSGNHEYYRNAIPSLTEKLRAESEGSNVILLEQDAIEVGGIWILGCTLWTDLSLYGSAFDGGAAVADVMVDFRLIRVSPKYRRLRPNDTVLFHRKSVQWLRQELSAKRGKSIVVTHHAPSSRSLSAAYEGNAVNAAFASNLEGLVEEYQPSLWIHGHSHSSADYRIGNTRVLCNPRGYPDEENVGFEPGLVVEIA